MHPNSRFKISSKYPCPISKLECHYGAIDKIYAGPFRYLESEMRGCEVIITALASGACARDLYLDGYLLSRIFP
jgi:hypothetical protein